MGIPQTGDDANLREGIRNLGFPSLRFGIVFRPCIRIDFQFFIVISKIMIKFAVPQKWWKEHKLKIYNHLCQQFNN